LDVSSCGKHIIYSDGDKDIYCYDVGDEKKLLEENKKNKKYG